MDQIINFTTFEGNKGEEATSHSVQIKVRTGTAGIMELHPVYDLADRANDAVVFMFKGALSEEECRLPSREWNKENFGGTLGQLALQANKHHPACANVDGNEGDYTLWSPNGGVVTGFVKISEIAD